MAPRCPGPALGLFISHDCLEASLLNLSAEHIPFPCSLLELVLNRYTLARAPGSDAHAMELDELLSYLKNTDNFKLSPWMAIVNQTEAIGDPAVPTSDQSAILRWLGEALESWEQQFPLEDPLAAKVRQLKPLAAAFAILDPEFLVPGAHPLHLLLDSIQARGIGWQSHLDRVGKILEKQVSAAVDSAREWFDDNTVDLADIFEEFSAAAERDKSRARRMAQRIIETETGKVKTAAAKLEAAKMINAALQKYRVPAEIGDFLKGPWYSM